MQFSMLDIGLSALYDALMHTNEAIEYYGSATKLADALHITKAAISQWGDVVPELRALQLEKLTNGNLSVTDSQFSLGNTQ